MNEYMNRLESAAKKVMQSNESDDTKGEVAIQIDAYRAAIEACSLPACTNHEREQVAYNVGRFCTLVDNTFQTVEGSGNVDQ
tara:strand:- start:587 stop:832 length:246 start_codon:yes stop_codon:yes gene_type:complete